MKYLIILAIITSCWTFLRDLIGSQEHAWYIGNFVIRISEHEGGTLNLTSLMYVFIFAWVLRNVSF